jgi:hypothetical protein
MPYLLYLQEPPGKMLKMIYMRRDLVGKGWLGVKRLGVGETGMVTGNVHIYVHRILQKMLKMIYIREEG